MDQLQRLLAEMPRMAEVVNGFASPEVQREAFKELMRAFRGESQHEDQDQDADSIEPEAEEKPARRRPRSHQSVTDSESAPKARTRRTASDAVDANLDLRPDGVQSFREFADEKSPASDHERNAVAAYWLKHVAKVEKATSGMVSACYVEMGWRLPVNMRSGLQRTASKKHWLDTSDMEDVKVPNLGQNLVRHDLPRKTQAR